MENVNPKNETDNPNPWESLKDIGNITQGGPNLAGLLASVEKFVQGMDFPASKQEVLEHARAQNAPDQVMTLLQQLQSRLYSSPEDVARDAGKR